MIHKAIVRKVRKKWKNARAKESILVKVTSRGILTNNGIHGLSGNMQQLLQEEKNIFQVLKGHFHGTSQFLEVILTITVYWKQPGLKFQWTQFVAVLQLVANTPSKTKQNLEVFKRKRDGKKVSKNMCFQYLGAMQ